MFDTYMAEYFQIPVKNVFEVEEKVHYAWRIEYTHLTSAMNFHVPFYAVGCVDSKRLKGKYCVVMIRNICDTLASAYFQARYRDFAFSGTPSEFIRSHKFGALKIISFYNMLWKIRDLFERFDYFSYEDLRGDTEKTFRWFLKIAQIGVDDSIVGHVLEQSTFENMARLGMSSDYRLTWLSPVDPREENSRKMRNGGSSGEELFNSSDLKYICGAMDIALCKEDVPFFNGIR